MSAFAEAIAQFVSRTAVGAAFDAAEWLDKVAVGLRERSFWTARNTNVQLAQEMKDRVTKILGGQPKGINQATARAELKQLLAEMDYNPGEKAGTIQDLSSDARLNLILRMNTQSAYGFGQFKQGNTPAVLDWWPAQELFRAEIRKEPRDWLQRWIAAGGQTFPGGDAEFSGQRMIALKTDPIWTAISEFDTPYPPFDYNSGMWVRDVDRATAEKLGLISPNEQPTPLAVWRFNDQLQQSVKGIDPELLDVLKREFGDQLEIVDGVAKWVGQ